MPSPLEQMLGADDVDQIKQRSIMQRLLKNPVQEGYVDPTSPYYASGAMNVGKGGQTDAIGGILPDRSGDPGMAFKSNKGAPQRMAPRDQGLSLNLILTLIEALKGR